MKPDKRLMVLLDLYCKINDLLEQAIIIRGECVHEYQRGGFEQDEED